MARIKGRPILTSDIGDIGFDGSGRGKGAKGLGKSKTARRHR
jgi:hypothetical protein